MQGRPWWVVGVVACATGVLGWGMWVRGPQPAQQIARSPARTVAAGARDVPMVFEANLGQAAPDVRFLARGPGYSLRIGSEVEFVLQSRGGPTAVRMALHGAAPGAQPEGARPQAGHVRYLHGRDTTRWQPDVPLFGEVRTRAAWPGIDVAWYGNAHRLEYDFVVAPHADPRAIAIDFDGVRSLRVDTTGDLVLGTAAGDLVQQAPVVYQERDGHRERIAGRYRLLADRRVGFELGRYDPERAIVIDPVIAYSSYLGGSGDDYISSVTTDAAGNVIVFGYTTSLDYPVSHAAQTTWHGVGDVFVTKFDPNDDTVLYSTYLGGSGDDLPFAVQTDAAGNAYLAGSTTSADFPTKAALQGAHANDAGQNDAFVAKLDPNGNLLFSTFLGGAGDDGAYALALDATGTPWVAGYAGSVDFPVVTPYQAANQGGTDGFIAHLSGDGAQLQYASYFGGSGDDRILGIALDAQGRPHVAGQTTSANLPLASPYQSTLAGGVPASVGGDAFVAVLSAAGDSLAYSSYFGGSGDDRARDIAVDDAGGSYVVGSTRSPNFPVYQAAQPTFGGFTDGFVLRIGPLPNPGLVFSTYVGGLNDDILREVSLRGSLVDVTGSSNSADFPLSGNVASSFNRGSTDASGCSTSPCYDAVAAEFSQSGQRIVSFYVGGSGDDDGLAIANYGRGDYYVAGQTTSHDAHTANAASKVPAGGLDAFLTRIGVRALGSTYTHDLDGDFAADLVWRNKATGANVAWRGAKSSAPLAIATLATSWSLAAVGDFDCDGRDDLVWRDAAHGTDQIWLGGNAATPRSMASAPAAWKIAAVLDLQQRGCKSDIVWRNTGTGANVVWLGGSSTTTRSLGAVTDTGWEIVGQGDFDGDGWNDDLLWRHRSSGADVVWLDANSRTPRSVTGVTNLDWRVAGVGDFLDDGTSDILWHNLRTGASVVWRGGNAQQTQAVTTVTDTTWEIAAVGDYDGDGRSDIAWRQRTTGAGVVWSAASSTHARSLGRVSDLNWTMLP